MPPTPLLQLLWLNENRIQHMRGLSSLRNLRVRRAHPASRSQQRQDHHQIIAIVKTPPASTVASPADPTPPVATPTNQPLPPVPTPTYQPLPPFPPAPTTQVLWLCGNQIDTIGDCLQHNHHLEELNLAQVGELSAQSRHFNGTHSPVHAPSVHSLSFTPVTRVLILA